VRYRLTGAGLSPAGSRQLRLTHRNRKFESSSLQRRVSCEPDHPDAGKAGINVMFEFTAAGERIRCPDLRRAARH